MMRTGIKRRFMHLCFWLGLFAALSATASTAAQAPLVLGILPFASHVSLFKRFAPLREYLSQQLGREVILESASDYPTFLARTHQRRYDIVLTAPHFALYELDDGHYQAMTTYLKPLSSVFLVHRDSPIQHLEQLRGKTIATPPAKAIITLAGKHFLSSTGLINDKTPSYRTYQSHNAAYHAVIGGEAEAAVISPTFIGIINKQKLPLRILGKSPDFPSMGILGASDLGTDLRRRITDIMINMHIDPSGKIALEKMSYPGYREIKSGEFDAIRPYLAFMPEQHGQGH